MSFSEKVELEILSNRFQAVVDEMAQVIFRTAHTVFVKETQDYGSVLVSLGGEIFAAPRRYGVLNMMGMPMGAAIRCVGDDVREGDIFITNDPEATEGMVTHLSDVFLWKPIFHEGELVCYAWTFIHMSDVGGRVSGSIAPSSYELVQEGIRVPPRKLYREGVLDEEFLHMFLVNTRTGDQNWGDMKALLAGLATAERRVKELIASFGRAKIRDGIPRVLDYAETQARRIIGRVPNGTYRYSDFMEADMVGLGLLRVNLAMTVKDGEMLLDFTGTAPQVRAALNLPTYSKTGHWMVITALTNWLCTIDPTIAYNAGLVRPFRIHAPKGSLLNPMPGAAYGARYATSHKVGDVTIGALAQAVPNELPATDSGQGSILLVSVPDFERGTNKVSVIQPIVGGSGGRPGEDGVDGTMVMLNFLKNVPTEVLEREMPEILIRRYALRPDSAGAGKYRGGTGIEIEFETSVPYTTVTSRCMERYIFPPAGRLGGLPGATGYTMLNPGGNNAQDIGKIDVLHLDAGDRLLIGTQGGGGFGDPLERPPARVLEDVLNGLVREEHAFRDYGVRIANGALDEAATTAERARRRNARNGNPLPEFTFGPARDRHDATWTNELYEALDQAIAPLPPLARQLMYQRLSREIEQRFARGDKVTPADISVIAVAMAVSQRFGTSGTA
ncbi:hydantoinase B/oxoprolinase family protein [Rhodoligotrophos defluvii]|uniref:hydantoinase B/oxoprolinase family protein n=1 Tax=Rhodoligotrophos defluvii TaxID=2561934 RepID=UPI0010C9A343|nr:hydantoinase B/oxoprolinase family protein [Rhodoligotrophos defluvii]